MKGRDTGYAYIHAAVDDHSRRAYVEVFYDERRPDCGTLLAAGGGLLPGPRRSAGL